MMGSAALVVGDTPPASLVRWLILCFVALNIGLVLVAATDAWHREGGAARTYAALIYTVLVLLLARVGTLIYLRQVSGQQVGWVSWTAFGINLLLLGTMLWHLGRHRSKEDI